jgi:hypothetical protein
MTPNTPIKDLFIRSSQIAIQRFFPPNGLAIARAERAFLQRGDRFIALLVQDSCKPT